MEDIQLEGISGIFLPLNQEKVKQSKEFLMFIDSSGEKFPPPIKVISLQELMCCVMNLDYITTIHWHFM